MTVRYLQIGAASRALPGEEVCGDQLAIVRDPQRALVALADGLGHGPEAASAARSAVDFVARDPWAPLDALMMGCHRAIASTRGAAVTLLRMDLARATVEHTGVGNVDVVALTRESMRFVALPGVVGGRIRKVVVTTQRLHHGDLFVLHTDGLSRRLEVGAHHEDDVDTLARRLIETHASRHDDAACVVVRW